MMAEYAQKIKFNFKKMGKTPGYCLQNVRLGYGIKSKFATAKLDMLDNKKRGTLHAGLKNIPKGVQVPLYWDVASPYEHINVSAGDGVYMYDDGKKVKIWQNTKFFGWGEYCEGVQIVKKKAAAKKLKKGDTVVPVKWVDYKGTKLVKTAKKYYVGQIVGNRAVLYADKALKKIYAAVELNNLKEVK